MMENYIGKRCIVRCYGAGVFFGDVTADAFKKRTDGSVAPQGVRAELPF